MTENMINFLKVRTLIFFPVDLLREPTTWFRVLRELLPRKKLLFSSERFYVVLHLLKRVSPRRMLALDFLENLCYLQIQPGRVRIRAALIMGNIFQWNACGFQSQKTRVYVFIPPSTSHVG